MKRAFLVLALIFSSINPSYAETTVQFEKVYYAPYDEVWTYTFPTFDNYDRAKAVFDSPSGAHYEKVFMREGEGWLNLTTWYLRCRGTYVIEWYDGETLVGRTGPIDTSEIVVGNCASGVQGGLYDDLGLTWTYGGGGYSLGWNSYGGASYYEIWSGGTRLGTTTGTSYHVSGSGMTTVFAYDANGNVIGRSDAYLSEDGSGNPGGGNPGGGSGGCNACQKLSEMLACPEWDTYMGEFTDAVRNAFEWPQIADTFRDSIVPAIEQVFGDTTYSGNTGITEPSLPTYQPKEPLPQPSDIEEKIDFDFQSDAPVFPEQDATPKGDDDLVIPDLLNWDSPATSPHPEPSEGDGARDTTPQPIDLQPRDTTPIGGDAEPRDTTPSGGEPDPRDTTPADGPGGGSTHPGMGEGKDTTPRDWKGG